MDFSWLAAIGGGAQGASRGLGGVLEQRNLEDQQAREDAERAQARGQADQAARLRSAIAAADLLKSGTFRVRGGAAPDPTGAAGTPTASPVAAAVSAALPTSGGPAAPAASAIPGASPVSAAIRGTGFLPQLEDLELVPQSEQDARTAALEEQKAAIAERHRPWSPKTMAQAVALRQAPEQFKLEHPELAARGGGTATDPVMSGLVHRASLIKGQIGDTRAAMNANQRIIDKGLFSKSSAADSAAYRAATAGLASLRTRGDSLRGALDQVGSQMAHGGAPSAPIAPAAPAVPAAPDPTAAYTDAATRYRRALEAGADPAQARAAYDAVIMRIARSAGQVP